MAIFLFNFNLYDNNNYDQWKKWCRLVCSRTIFNMGFWVGRIRDFLNNKRNKKNADKWSNPCYVNGCHHNADKCKKKKYKYKYNLYTGYAN